jgi:ribonuclease H2 subunit A
MLGVDEAGRGPVLGPMVYAVAFCPISETDALKRKDYADSKTLSEEKRALLLERIDLDSKMGHATDSLSAAFISSQMLSTGRTSLNALAFESTVRLLRGVLDMGVDIQQVYVDTVGDADRYRDKLASVFPGIGFTVCPKADAIYPIVSAASIVAKVTRDKQLREFTIEEKGLMVSQNFGSGYPGDPATKAWLESHIDRVFGFPSLVRFSWATCNPLLNAHAVKVHWSAEEDAGQATLTQSFALDGNEGPSVGTGRHSYFRARRLQKITAF